MTKERKAQIEVQGSAITVGRSEIWHAASVLDFLRSFASIGSPS